MSLIKATINDNTISLEGELTRHTLMQVSKKAIESLRNNEQMVVDLNQVSKVDTAGLAWLFYLLEQAQVVNCQLSFANLPTKLDNLINLSGVEGILPQ